jgi:hypothetical protein
MTKVMLSKFQQSQFFNVREYLKQFTYKNGQPMYKVYYSISRRYEQPHIHWTLETLDKKGHLMLSASNPDFKGFIDWVDHSLVIYKNQKPTIIKKYKLKK